ncbi:drug resistance transporter, EmrB/QacA subfamily [Dehalogenimonas alkenigignens]|uniref:Drug resistance transporter, EmrB/QacA subfamily n=1 Tax=Dehalogenimonas alkenigignens TaxID=1217799 RepID=A0A0W0GK70_9CHLR|nr:MDR family MFS transporter [Dehalogenimonas alkenigignens]KTB48948.1 drug resistance transporter, EmrB/QacA subfamily [Dehalogenimonas alkenigignens]
MSSTLKTPLVLAGMMLSMILASLDQTIVATAMPRIVQEFQGLSHLSWVFTAYMLASAVTVPIYGKLTDLFGRRRLLIIAVLIFLGGSMLSGLAQNMTQLIFFRGIQGVGAGAIMVNAFAIVADLFPPAQRGKVQGLFGAVFGITSVAGPLLGGWLTDSFSWRWIFYVNVPIGVVALAVIFAGMPRHAAAAHGNGERSIDYFGAVLLTATLVPLLLALVWGGSQYPWGSPEIITLLAVSAVALLGFLWRETKARDPIVTLSLFRNRVFTISVIATFLASLGMFGSILFIPVFAQGVAGFSATNSGLIMMPMMLAIVAGSMFAGQVMSRTGKYKVLAVSGLGIATLGMALFSQVGESTSQFDLIIRMVVMGVGLGFTMPIFTVAVQNAFSHSRIGEVTAGIQLFRTVGGTVGGAVLGGVMNAQLASKLIGIENHPFIVAAKQVSPGTPVVIDGNTIQTFLSNDGQAQIRALIAQAPEAIREQISAAFDQFLEILKTAFSQSIDYVFIIGAALMVVAFAASFFLPQLPLRKSHRPAAEELGVELDAAMGQSDKRHEPDILGKV